MEQHSSENLRLIAYGNFSKIITFWTEKLYKNNQAWRLGEANEAVVSVPHLSKMLWGSSVWEFRATFIHCLVENVITVFIRV